MNNSIKLNTGTEIFEQEAYNFQLPNGDEFYISYHEESGGLVITKKLGETRPSILIERIGRNAILIKGKK